MKAGITSSTLSKSIIIGPSSTYDVAYFRIGYGGLAAVAIGESPSNQVDNKRPVELLDALSERLPSPAKKNKVKLGPIVIEWQD